MHQAILYRKKQNNRVVCDLCGHHCRVNEGEYGQCGVRRNVDGTLYSLVYGRLVAENIDPIEKKPLFHVIPGSLSYSISTVGCNFDCLHCQNASISSVDFSKANGRTAMEKTADQVVHDAAACGCKSISYTYVEPTIFFEFAYDCCVAAHEKGLKNIFVSNGFMSRQATEMLAPKLDAINIDIKSFSEDFYKKVCSARLRPVLETVKLMKELGVWVEVTTLLIPGLNDSDEELAEIAGFIGSVDPSIPWHVTAFYPAHKMTDPPPTSRSDLRRARKIGIETGLNYVYQGNVPGEGGENSFCPACNAEVISRFGFQVRVNRLQNGCCSKCGEPIPGVWK